MKNLLFTATFLLAGFCGLAQQGTFAPLMKHKPVNKNPLMAADTVIWAGLDYSMVRMIGKDEFNVPDAIFPGMPIKWNTLFIDERIELVAKALRKQVSIDIEGVTERNKTATAKQIILTPGPKDVIKESHITQDDIATAVQSYKLEKKSGLGLVFIVDRFIEGRYVPPEPPGNKTGGRIAARGAVYVVFFDVATREVISAKREVDSVGTGSNFRNTWFSSIKDADQTLSKYR